MMSEARGRGGSVRTGGARGSRVRSGLTAAKVATVREPGKYHDRGGLGLYLRIDPSGGRYWVQRLVIAGKRHELGLGAYPLVSLAAAREMAFENKRTVRAGGDPLRERRAARTQRAVPTFAEAVERYLAEKLKEFRNPKHAAQWRSTLEAHAVPVLGSKGVDAMDVEDVRRVLEPIWETKIETASRLRGRIESVLAWATVAGHRSGENPAIWRNNLAFMLPAPSKVARKDNQPAPALGDAQRWWRALGERDGMAARALAFLALTALRSDAVRRMEWREVDLEAAVWTVPAAHTKTKTEHRVPLAPAAVALLRAVPRSSSPLVFFAARGGVMSDMALSMVMRRLHEAERTKGGPGFLDPRSGRPAVPHGLRSTFRDFAAEHGFEHTVAELALAHKVGSQVERAYRRSDLFDRRRGLMHAWAEFLEGERATSDLARY